MVLVSGVQQISKVIQLYIYMCILFQVLFHYKLLKDIEYSSLCYTVGPCCLPVFFFLIFNLLFIIFIYGCVGSSFLCEGFLQLRRVGGHSSPRCAGLFTIAASLVAEHRLQTLRLSSCGSRAQLLCGMWELPRPGLEPVSPALAGGFSTTAPPGKPYLFYI